ncbi:MAG: hypothetical protein Rhob2KO_43310 [Rhodopirellula baltica]
MTEIVRMEAINIRMKGKYGGIESAAKTQTIDTTPLAMPAATETKKDHAKLCSPQPARERLHFIEKP